MSASFYNGMKGVALGLLKQFGQSMTLQRVTPGTYDPATGSKTDTTEDITVTGAIFDIEDARVNGSTVLRGDKVATISAKGLDSDPKANADLLYVGGERHQIVSVKPLAPGGVPVTYDLQVRKAA